MPTDVRGTSLVCVVEWAPRWYDAAAALGSVAAVTYSVGKGVDVGFFCGEEERVYRRASPVV